MKIIRTGCFETNSSSSHSVAIAEDTLQFVYDSIYPDDDGQVTLEGGEWGWEWFKTNSAQEKANYAAQQFENQPYYMDNLKEVILEQTKASKVVVSLNGYIDHQSMGIVSGDKEALRNFIFNKNSWLFGGNDNSDTPEENYLVPEYRDGKIIPPMFKFKIEVEGLEPKYLVKLPKDEGELKDKLLDLFGNRACYFSEDGKLIFDNENAKRIFTDKKTKNKVKRYTPCQYMLYNTNDVTALLKRSSFPFSREDLHAEAMRLFKKQTGSDKPNCSAHWQKISEITDELAKKDMLEVNFFISPIDPIPAI
jgi:hypothetical protein